MTKLSSVVGGILRDLARSHAVSDASTMEILDAYGRDAELSQLPVPRLSIREARVTLRFAISAIQDETRPPNDEELRDLWLAALKDRVVPRALREIGRADNRQVTAAFDRVVEQGGRNARVDSALLLGGGREDELVKLSHAFLVRQVSTIAPSTKRHFESLDVTGALERSLRDEVPGLLDAVREFERARAAEASDLNVAITTGDLSAVPENQISELLVTVSMEEVQRSFASPSGSVEG